uniref:hypothetical protein n=1 Tax=Candidatus Ichthyocystis hellenicum TaxID=1561003 RepID=UPI001111AB2C
MCPLSSVTSNVADFVGAPDSEDDGANKGGTVQGGDLQQVEATAPAASTAAVGKGASTGGKGKAPAKKFGTLDALSLLGVVLSPESTQIVEGVFIKADVLARRTYRSTVAKQLPSRVSEKLTLTGRGIWYFTYRAMCEDSFMSKCISEYHYKHRPDFIRDLPRIQVLSDSSGGNLVSLTGGGLLDFLSRLDGAVYDRVKSVFGSCWSEVSVALEGESLSVVSCKDFINVLDVANIPPLAMSPMLIAVARNARRKGLARSKDTVECAALGVSATGLAHSSPSGSQSLSSQSHTELSSAMHSQSESRAEPSFPSGEVSGTTSELTLLSSVEVSSDLIAAKVHKDDGVSTSTDTGVVLSAVGMPPIPSELADTLTSSAISSSSPCVSLSVQCVDLPGIELHPDSAELINKLFREVRRFAKNSFSHSMISYIPKISSSELTVVVEAICFKTYRELHLYKFMRKFSCMYHYRYYPDFIRTLDSILVLSSSSDPRLVPLSGARLLDFLSRLDCAIREVVWSTFNSEWDGSVGGIISELEGESLSTLSCEDFIRVFGVVGVPAVSLTVSQRYYTTGNRRRAIRKGEMSGSGSSKSAVDVTGSGSSTVPHLQSETLTDYSSATTTPITTTVGEWVSTRLGRGRGLIRKDLAQRCGTSIAVSSSASATGKVLVDESGGGRFYAQKSAAVVLDCCAPLCAMVLPGCALMIQDLFSKVGALARGVYEDMVSKHLPPEISDKLSVTERAIWYRTYKATCEVSFVSRCFGEYYAEHRPDFVLSLSKIQVLLGAEGNLLDFLLELDRAVRREIESIFNSCWSEVSVSLEEESLSSISCRNFVKVLDVAGIPELVLSSTRVESSTKEIGSKGKRVASVTSVIDLTHSSPPSSQSLPSQSSSQLGSSLPSGETSSVPPELTLLSFSVGDPMGESSSAPIAAKRHKGSDSVPVPTHAEVGTVCTTALGVAPVSTEASTPTSSSVSISSSGASLSVQCVDLLDVKLHPDSAKLIYDLFCVLRGSAKKSYSNVLGHLLSTVISELSAVGRVVWCRTYRELHLLSFMARCLCLYHSKYRPDFIRSLAGIRVLSGSSGRSLVPLRGGELLSFLSKLDCAIREEVESIFSLEWDRVADSVFTELEDGSL